MEKISQIQNIDFNIFSHIINYFPVSKSFSLAKNIKNKFLSRILYERCFKQSAYIVAPKNNTLVFTTIPDNKIIDNSSIPKINFENHMKWGIKNYCFYFVDKKLHCFQFEPFKVAEFTFEEDIDTIHFIPLSLTSFNAIVNRATMYRYENLVETSKLALPKDVVFEPAVLNGLVYHDLFSDNLVAMNMNTLYLYEFPLQQTTYTTIISKDYVIIDCSQEDETLPNESILPITKGKDEEDTRYMKRNALFKMKLIHGDKGKIEIEFLKYLPHTLQFEVLDNINGFYWAFESVKMDETNDPLDYAYFYHKDKEINKFLIPNRKDVTNIEKFDADRVVIQYETRIILLSSSSGKVITDIDLSKDFKTDLGVVTGSGIFSAVGDYLHLQCMIEKDGVEKWKKYILDQDFKIIQEINEDWYQWYYG